MKMKGEEKAITPVVAKILLIVLIVISASLLYFIIEMTPVRLIPLESIGGILEISDGGWNFTCTDISLRTKDYLMENTYFVLQTKDGDVKNSSTLQVIENAATGYAVWYDNDNNDKLTPGDNIFIRSAYINANDTIQITTADMVLYDKTLP